VFRSAPWRKALTAVRCPPSSASEVRQGRQRRLTISSVNSTDADAILKGYLGFDHPDLRELQAARLRVAPADETLAHLRVGLDGDRYLRWATAVTLARLGVSDGDELAALVAREFDWSLIPGPPFTLWEGAMWHLVEAAEAGRPTGAVPFAIEALTRADPADTAWTDVIDEALALIAEEPTKDAIPAVSRIATEHWQDIRRDEATELLTELENAENR
jgi:hypothetical protein